jgi:hypothetical protein
MGKFMYEKDEIIFENLKKERQKAIELKKSKRQIEPLPEASFANKNVLLQKDYKPEQEEYYDPKAKRREYQKQFEKKFEKVVNPPSKFEIGDQIKLSPREEDMKNRLIQEIQRRDGLKDPDQAFRQMVDEEDQINNFNSSFDVDNSGKFIKGHDGYALGESVDFHDAEGVDQSIKVPRIIGKTNPKTEILHA